MKYELQVDFIYISCSFSFFRRHISCYHKFSLGRYLSHLADTFLHDLDVIFLDANFADTFPDVHLSDTFLDEHLADTLINTWLLPSL
jgi:hypothetical protein